MAHSVNDVAGNGEAGSSGTSIEIKIKTMDSQTYTMQVDKQMPVPALKERIASVTGVVTEHQRLICRGKVLKDDQLLSAYHVEDGHTLHLVVREPNASSSGSLPADPAVDRSSNGNRGQYYQVAPGIVVETFNMPGQGDRVLPDVSRIVSAVLGSIGITNPGNGNETTGIRDHVGDRPGESPIPDGMADATRTQPEQSGMRSSNDRSRLHNAFGIPAGLSFGSFQSPTVIPDALVTLSQYLSNMRQGFTESGRTGATDTGASLQGNDGGSSSLAQSASVPEGLPSPASLAALLSSTRQMLDQQVEACLLQLQRQLENQENMTDPEVRVNAQSGALRNGILLQNLGAYFLELGRTVTTLRFGGSPAEAVVNTGPAVFISSSGPNPLMVQPVPFQPGASFGTPLSGTIPPNSGSTNGSGGGFPRRIDIQIRRVGSSTHQTEPVGSRLSSGQRNPTTNVSGEEPVNQSSNGTAGVPSSNNGPAVRILPLRSMMAAVPDLNRTPQDSSGNPLGFLYPVLGRYSSTPSGNLSSRTGNQVSNDHPGVQSQPQPQSAPEPAAVQQNVEGPSGNVGRVPASVPGQRESVSSRTIDINILSAGGVQNDQNSEGQIPPGIFQILRGLFPGGEFHVESVSSQGTGTGSSMEPERTSNVAAQEAEPTAPSATEEGLFLSRMLQQIMPLISQNSGTEQNAGSSGGDASQQGDGSASSTAAENHEVGTSRRKDDDNPGPNPKRQKRE